MSTTPRANLSTLSSYTNKTVRIIARIESVSQLKAELYVPNDDASNTKIEMSITPDLNVEAGNWYEIIARVTESLGLIGIDVVNFGTNLNENGVLMLSKVVNKVPEMYV